MFHGMELEHEGIFESAEEARSIFDDVNITVEKELFFCSET